MRDTRPRIVFVTTCKGRAQHIKQTLLKNIRDNRDYPNCRFVLLNYSSTDDLMDYVEHNCREVLEDNLLRVYTFLTNGRFRMAHAKNMAHRLGINLGADILVNLDADNFTGPGFATYLAQQFEDQDIFMAIGKFTPGVTPRGLSGRIVVTAETFLNSGGYDEKYEDWGPDDKDFNHRLRRMGYEWREIDWAFMDCLRHNDKMRFREYPHAKTSADSGSGLVNCEHTVCNFGNIGCGIVYENFRRCIVELNPVPTRIFGIGMHKTGTTSLHTALNIMGLNSAHWLSAGWAKKVWREMNTVGRSNTLERNYAACDLPISPLFKKLDVAYPGSKFILTIRSEENWIGSVRRHWSPETNPFRHQWDSDPFTHIIHNAIYGRTEFHGPTMRQAYRRHNKRVMEHFKDRPGDLLVLNIDKPVGWYQLCQFLGVRDYPPVPFPRVNKSL